MTFTNPDLAFVDVWTRTPDFEVAKKALSANVRDNHKVIDILGENEVRLLEGIRTQVGFSRHLVADVHSNAMGMIAALFPFEKGAVYAMPIRDSNKSVATVSGEVTISNLDHGTNDEILTHLRNAISEKLTTDGHAHDSIVLGGFSVAVSQPKEVSEQVERIGTTLDCEDDPYNFALYVNEKFHSIHIELEDAIKIKDEILLDYNFRPGYKGSMFPRVDIHTMAKVQKTAWMNVHETLTYDFTARLYDVSGDPDGWAFYGVKE